MKTGWMALLLAIATPGLAATPAVTAVAETPATAQLNALLKQHWAWYLASNPISASLLGDRSGDGKLGDPSLAEADRQAAQAAAFVKRLDAIDPAGLSEADRLNRLVLRRSLSDQVEANGFPQRAMLFSNRSGWHTFFADLPTMLPLFNKADYLSYVERLEAFPAYNAAAIAVSRTALKDGQVQPCESMRGFDKTISTTITATPQESVFWGPFAKQPTTITDADWVALKARAATAISGGVMPAYRDLLAFYTQDYAPKCRASYGLSALPRGGDYYDFLVRSFTTTNMTAEQVHALGLKEVARITGEMDAVTAASGFKGDRKAYVQQLRTDPKYYAKTPQELMEHSALAAKTIDGWMPKLFGTLPRLPYTVREIPAATADGNTTAYYNEGSYITGTPGVYFVNTTHLDQRPLYEIPALTLHEAVPGHHQQISIAQEAPLPDFRRYATFFTAFVEGWGLYSERLGIEMGLYDTPEKNMGRLSYEAWRANRLVVDTGIHAKGWSRQQAIDYMLANTALSQANIEAEVNRYITGPGQALAYKIGELTIRRLRTKAETELGTKFDLRKFHDAVLENGALPMDLLEAHIDAWIAAQKALPVTAG
jgi:uncharacterized protein (DUF885 family)